MFRIFEILIFLFVCYKWGDWRNWKKYYATILYVIIGDLSYNFVFFNFDLWRYYQLVNHTFSDIIVAFTVLPCGIILFNTHYPQQNLRKILYILTWSFLCAFLEFIFHKMSYILYYNQWNILWSFGVFFIAFCLIRLHLKYPPLTWALSLVLAILVAIIFRLPVSVIK